MEKLLSTQHVADILGLHIKTFQKKLRNNDIALRLRSIVASKGRFPAFGSRTLYNRA